MTRYARAHGSKASNERTPEEATSWSAMKQQIIASKNQKEDHGYDKIISDCRQRYHNKSDLSPINKVWELFETDRKESVSIKGVTKNEKQSNSSIFAKNPKSQNNNCVITKNANDSLAGSKQKKLSVKGNTFVVRFKDSGDEALNNVFQSTNGSINLKRKAEKINDSQPNLMHEASDIEPISDHCPVKKLKSIAKKKKIVKPYCAENGDVSHEFSGKHNEIKKNLNNFNRNDAGVSGRSPKTEYKNNTNNNNSYASFSYSNFNRNQTSTMNIGGRMVEIADFQGFAVKKEDAQRLCKLRKDLNSKGVPRKEVEIALKAERRRAEKALAREKKFVCYKCRKFGHNMSECTECDDQSGVCFKCGSTEHSVRECRVVQSESFRYAHCFICQEPGHIARQCPDNPRGLYPKGGACKVCGDVTHLKKDCPQLINEKEKSIVTVGTVQNNSIEVLDEDLQKEVIKKNISKKTSFIKF